MTDAPPDPPDDSPQLERGYMQVAHALIPALLAARFRLEAAMVLSEVLAQCWGRSKETVAVLEIPAIAEQWGLLRPNVWRGLRELKDSGVVVAEAGSTTRVRFDKRALYKILPPNIAGGLGAYRDRAVRKPSVSTADTASKNGVASPVSTVDTLGVSTCDTQPVSTVDTVSGSPQTPLLGREKRRQEERIRAGERGLIQFPKNLPADHPDHPCNADDKNPGKEFIHNGPYMPENFGELERKAFDLFRGRDTPFPSLLAGKRSEPEWIDWFITIPADLWHEALRDLAAKKDPLKWTPEFYLGCVRRAWQAAKDRRRMAENAASAEKPKSPRPAEYHVASESFKARHAAQLKARQEAMGISA